MAAWIGAGIAAAGALGDVMSSQGQQSTNAQMLAQNQQIMNWETNMSNTAMQRRVEDLKAAGLNPALAVGQGGASVPSVGAVQLGNPSASFGNLGGQAAGAAQGGAAAAQAQQQAPVASAQAVNLQESGFNQQMQGELAKVRALNAAGVDTDVQRQSIAESQARIPLLEAQAEAARANASLTDMQRQVAEATVPKIQAEIRNLAASTNQADSQAALNRIGAVVQGLNANQIAKIMPDVLATAAANRRIAQSNQSVADLDALQAQQSKQFYSDSPAFGIIEKVFNLFHVGANLSGSSSGVSLPAGSSSPGAFSGVGGK